MKRGRHELLDFSWIFIGAWPIIFIFIGNQNKAQMSSISALLEQTLDLIAEEGTSGNGFSSNAKTAASMLLEEKKQMKKKLENIETTSFQFPKTDSLASNPLLDQISTSRVEAPKYWNTSGGKKPKVAAVASISKKMKLSRQKGQDYSDKYQEKMGSKVNKQKLKNKLKN